MNTCNNHTIFPYVICNKYCKLFRFENSSSWLVQTSSYNEAFLCVHLLWPLLSKRYKTWLFLIHLSFYYLCHFYMSSAFLIRFRPWGSLYCMRWICWLANNNSIAHQDMTMILPFICNWSVSLVYKTTVRVVFKIWTWKIKTPLQNRL